VGRSDVNKPPGSPQNTLNRHHIKKDGRVGSSTALKETARNLKE